MRTFTERHLENRDSWIVAACFCACLGCGDPGAGLATPADGADTPAMAPDDALEPADASDAPPEACEVPSQPAELLAYLQRGDYKAFQRESAAHASTGPHGGRVLTYVNDVLFDSLGRGDAEHPRCAASIKELFLGNDEVSGWAVLVKTEEASANGKGYYWLETFSTSPNRPAAIEGQGIGACVGCHSAGSDSVLTPWPLQ
jgi:hypothetical protein